MGYILLKTEKILWPELLAIDNQMSLPWCVMGDFNIVLACGDRLNGNLVSTYETHDFMRLPARNINLVATSTLANKRLGDSRIVSRIDRCLVHSFWLSMFPSLTLEYMNPVISDHSPLVWRCSTDETGQDRPFKFFNYMADHSEFLNVVENQWQRSSGVEPMKQVWDNLYRVKMQIKQVKRDYGKLHDQINKSRVAVSHIQFMKDDPISQSLAL